MLSQNLESNKVLNSLSPQALGQLRLYRLKVRRSQASGKKSLDLSAFAQSLGFSPDEWQKKLLQWNGKRILLNCARQSGKSTTAALLGVYRAIYFQHSLVLLVSPSLRQSSELFRKVTDWLNHCDVGKLKEDNRLSCTLQNDSRIVSLPSSEATIRGYSAVNLAIFDEAARVDDPLYFAVRPMLAVSGGSLIAMSTPFGKRGWWWDAWSSGGDEWERIKAPATQNPRLTPSFLESEHRAMGDWWFDQEYMCEFKEGTDSVFSYEVVAGAMSDEVLPLFGATIDDVGAVSAEVEPLAI